MAGDEPFLLLQVLLIEADGIGISPKENRGLRGIFDTPPSKWKGTNPTLHRQCGLRLAVFFTRVAPVEPPDLDALVRYIATIERPPGNRSRDPEGLRTARNQSTVGTTMWLDTNDSVGAFAPGDTTTFGPLGIVFFHNTGGHQKRFDGALGPESRIASTVIGRSELPFVNAGAAPATIDEIINPRIFRCPVADARYHECLMNRILDSAPDARLAIIRTPSALTRMHLNWWLARARFQNQLPVVNATVTSDLNDLGPVVHDIRARQVNVVVTWADAGTSARILSQLRREGMDSLFVGSDEIVTDAFIRLDGSAPGRVVAPVPCRHRIHGDADADGQIDKRPSMATKNGNPGNNPTPDLSFMGALHLLEAVDAAGSDRDAVRRKLLEMSTPVLARLIEGHWKPEGQHDVSPNQ